MGRRGNKTGRFRSGLEAKTAKDLKEKGQKIKYETMKIAYVIPQTAHTYTPDFVLANGIIIEVKGRLERSTRKKHLCIRESNPELDIRFVFGNAGNKIHKGAKQSYGEWCNNQDPPFLWSDKGIIPQSWIDEK